MISRRVFSLRIYDLKIKLNSNEYWRHMINDTKNYSDHFVSYTFTRKQNGDCVILESYFTFSVII